MEKSARHAFISYVREDAHHVDQLQQVLEAAGFSVWRDTADLWPGEDWRMKIRHAITGNALVFIACFSSQSVARTTSYQYEELTLAVDQLRLRRPDVPWLIPVRFDDCAVPDLEIGGGRTLGSIQRADLFGDYRDTEIMRLLTVVQRLIGKRPAENRVSAFVLITAPSHRVGHIIRTLHDEYRELVVEATRVYGEADIVARIETPSVERLHEFVMGTVQNMPDVRVTRTFIIIP